MTRVFLRWHGYRYFPYERELAKREVKALFGCAPREVDEGLEVSVDGPVTRRLKRLTYVREGVLPEGETIVTDQARLEASVRLNGKPHRSALAAPIGGGRQRTRYSAHGLHEYRGKFNPQVVRAIGNMLRLPHGAWILDPFCGSGTTLLESAHAGWNAIGVDLNPLAVLISNAKLRAIRAEPIALQRTARQLVRRLGHRTKELSYTPTWSEREMEGLAGAGWPQDLPNFDYLAAWFPRSVLAQFVAILKEIDQTASDSLGLVFKVILSDLVRSVSFQDPGDLRIRRRKHPEENYPVIPMFLQDMEIKISAVVEARKALGRVGGHQEAFIADSRASLIWIRKCLEPLRIDRFDAAITSPPYATALPYVDTQRLSLCLLGLIDAKVIPGLQRELIGTREVNESKRTELEDRLLDANRKWVPQSVTGLCRRMLRLTRNPGNGFRRRNMPALIFQYFADMAEAFRQANKVMKSGAPFALVVGRNRTVLGGQSILINTPELLAEVACANGWRLRALLELDAYQRFDMHRRNSIETEGLVLLERL